MVTFMFTVMFVSILGLGGYANKDELKNIQSVDEAVQWVRDIEPAQDYKYPGEQVQGE